MKKSKFTETQIVKILKEVEGGRLVKVVCREHGISDATYTTGRATSVAWKPEFISIALTQCAEEHCVEREFIKQGNTELLC